MHDENIGHFDIKEGNVLVKRKSNRPDFDTAVLIDFDTTKTCASPEEQQDPDFEFEEGGTPSYTAPERHEDMVEEETAVETVKSDIWSLAVMLFMLSQNGGPRRHGPFDSKKGCFTTDTHYENLKEGVNYIKEHHAKIWDTFSDEYKSFFTQCFVVDPADRADANQAYALLQKVIDPQSVTSTEKTREELVRTNSEVQPDASEIKTHCQKPKRKRGRKRSNSFGGVT